jgi:hypothetical protein
MEAHLSSVNDPRDHAQSEIISGLRVTLGSLKATVATLPPLLRDPRRRYYRSTMLASAIVKYFLGQEWLEKHQNNGSEFQFDDHSGLEAGVHEIQCMRLIDLGECLYNLQSIVGIEDCLDRMRSSASPEAALAELHIAKMLYVNGWDFRFIKPKGKRGDNYDFEVKHGGLVLCCETKCKISTTEIGSRTITTVLNAGRDQLPADKPGVFFIKLPQKWLDHPGIEAVTTKGVLDFYAQGTKRVVSVIYYVEPVRWLDGRIRQEHRFAELANPRHRFSNNIDWTLLKKWWPSEGAVNAMPSSWTRFNDICG